LGKLVKTGAKLASDFKGKMHQILIPTWELTAL